jgi:hypothetical protein
VVHELRSLFFLTPSPQQKGAPILPDRGSCQGSAPREDGHASNWDVWNIRF